MAEPAQIEKYTAIKRISDDASEDVFLDVGFVKPTPSPIHYDHY